MSKGGGSKVNLGPAQNVANKQLNLSDQLVEMAKQWLGRAQNVQAQYIDPLMSQLYGVIGMGTEYGGGGKWSYPEGKPYVSPTQSNLFQAPTFMANQQAGAAKKNILNNPFLGQGQKSALLTNVDQSKMSTLATNAFSTVQNLINSALQTGQNLYGTDISAGTSLMGQGVGMLGTAGGLESQLAQMQMQAATAGQKTLAQGLGGIASIAAYLVPKALSAMSPAGGAAAGGAAADVAGVQSAFENLRMPNLTPSF